MSFMWKKEMRTDTQSPHPFVHKKECHILPNFSGTKFTSVFFHESPVAHYLSTQTNTLEQLMWYIFFRDFCRFCIGKAHICVNWPQGYRPTFFNTFAILCTFMEVAWFLLNWLHGSKEETMVPGRLQKLWLSLCYHWAQPGRLSRKYRDKINESFSLKHFEHRPFQKCLVELKVYPHQRPWLSLENLAALSCTNEYLNIR